jgi:hypothetical protein
MESIEISQEIRTLINNIKDKISELSKKGIKEEAQIELSHLINLMQRIENCLVLSEQNRHSRFSNLFYKIFFNKLEEYRRLKRQQLLIKIEYIELAVNGLLQEKPNVALAIQIRRSIEYHIIQSEQPFRGPISNFFRSLIFLSSAPAKILIGLALALPIYLSFPWIAYSSINNVTKLTYVRQASQSELEDYKENLSILVLVASAGGLGSIISILTRIKEYDSQKYTDSFLPLVIGIFKPIIGASFGVLIFALVSSQILPIATQEKPGTKHYFFLSVAFIIGFSERFANDIVSRTEDAITGSRKIEVIKPSQVITPEEPSKSDRSQF